MQRTQSQYARLMELDGLIRAGKYPNCLTFAVKREVTPKTVQRDIDFLRDQLDAPIRYDRIHKGFCYDTPTWVLPAIIMAEGDLLALMLASRALEQYRGSPVAKQLERLFTKPQTRIKN